MTPNVHIMWFEQDLRLHHNPALQAAVDAGHCLPIFILDEENTTEWALGGASKWWLHQSLNALNTSLNGCLNVYYGDPITVITKLCSQYNVRSVYWNRRYEPWRMHRDKQVKKSLRSKSIHAESFNGTLLNEPWAVLKKDGTPYQVFTPYHRVATGLDQHAQTFPAPKSDTKFVSDASSQTLQDLSLRPKTTCGDKLHNIWTPGEVGARRTLNHFLTHSLSSYQVGRDFPARQSVSTLSAHLHFGEISPQQILEVLPPGENNTEHLKRELRWREFSYYLLFHFPQLPHQNWKPKFDRFPWNDNPEWLTLWQQGLTGYPLVDAGMRELWQTGYMHNRVRMITASFLVKNLLIDWRLGAQWFWDCLVDADLANNSASWQWVAGCGADASPYFRIFNPVIQGEKFDPDGTYTKQYIPELKDLPMKYLFRPWDAPQAVLDKSNIVLGTDYPLPIVDIKESRAKALAAYHWIKEDHAAPPMTSQA